MLELAGRYQKFSSGRLVPVEVRALSNAVTNKVKDDPLMSRGSNAWPDWRLLLIQLLPCPALGGPLGSAKAVPSYVQPTVLAGPHLKKLVFWVTALQLPVPRFRLS